MKINDKILSIPPYISTSWRHVKSLQMKGPFLVITLMGGESINIPNLKGEVIEQIFSAHAEYLEKSIDSQEESDPTLSQAMLNTDQGEVPFKLGIGSIDGMGNPLIHNPAQRDAPDIPKQILEKIAAIAKIISPEELNVLPKAELDCNCLHCQIVRTINIAVEPEMMTAMNAEEEEVKEEELVFQQWDVTQAGDKLFNVMNKLDTQENYRVYLGHPVGCTCGKSSCEHIVAVLKS
ncbi:hypothetical protein [Neochlamydia sp. S13]|uniref:hypothetical protein n=1 Tax=Neochlamydia sp. S13 TaxID=1353976 RepID=UPI0005A7C90E|nr:hypothetical protein [Neochlamydia sp. S13]BBI17544.1 Uncharacterized protein NCS13_1_1349 [Neochlamydia sp. S13]